MFPIASTAFVSYSPTDSDFVLRLASDMKAAGANVWVDRLDILPGMRWADAVESALDSSPLMLVVLSPVAVLSADVSDQVSFALEKQKTIIPIVIQDCPIPRRLSRISIIDFREGYARGLATLLKQLGREEELKDFPAAAAGEPAIVAEPVPSKEKPSDNATRVRVFYATDRREIRTRKSELSYDRKRSQNGDLHFGQCEVSIPKIHKVGKLEGPSILKLEFRADPGKHIVLARTQSLEEDEFLEQVAASVARSTTKEAFVFIHGYNVSFVDAARRTGQMAFDLKFVGTPILYSWPSNDVTADYLKDETNITWSTPHFQRFLSLLSQHSGAQRISIIAHSMGNRAVCDALKALSYEPTNRLKFNHLILAAPDIDADTFRELASTLRLSGRVTLYESSNDKAIRASKVIHGNPRAGEPLLIVAGMDTIDASAVDTDFLGHSYFSDSWPLLSDIHSILSRDEPPSTRFGLEERDDPEGKYFAFRT